MNSEMKNKIESCMRTAEDFTRLYYASLDNRRHKMSSLYLANSVFVWNGNGAQGKEMIHKYFIELPNSKHTMTTLDAQPITCDAVGGQLTYMIQTCGSVVYVDHSLQFFQQAFIITAENERWKIASDVYRLQNSMLDACRAR